MIVIAKTVTKKAALLRSPEVRSSQTALLNYLNQMMLDEESSSRGFMYFWGISVAVAFGTALAGASILGWAFVISLLKSN